MLNQILLRATRNINYSFCCSIFPSSKLYQYGKERLTSIFDLEELLLQRAFILICLTSIFIINSQAQRSTQYGFTDCINYWYHFRHIFLTVQIKEVSSLG